MSVFCTLTKLGPFFRTSWVTVLGASDGAAPFGLAPIAAPPWLAEEFILSGIAAFPLSGLFGDVFCAMALAPARALAAIAANRNLRMSDLLRADRSLRNSNVGGKFQARLPSALRRHMNMRPPRSSSALLARRGRPAV